MSRLKLVAIIVILLTVGVSSNGCNVIGHKEQIDQADSALQKGNVNAAIKQTKNLQMLYPRNYWAKRMMKKIEEYTMKEARDAWEAKDYKLAAEKAKLVLSVNPQNPEAEKIKSDAQKYTDLAQAQLYMDANNPAVAMKLINSALEADPQFKEALELKAKADKIVAERINQFLDSAEGMMEKGDYKAVETMAEEILTLDPQNKEVTDLLVRAKEILLQHDKEENLLHARQAYQENLYESAKRYAEMVLAVDENNDEAKELVENCKAEMLKPQLRLTGFLTIKDTVYASIMITGDKELHRVKEGDTFGDFKLSAIDRDLGAVVVTYLKTGSQETLVKE